MVSPITYADSFFAAGMLELSGVLFGCDNLWLQRVTVLSRTGEAGEVYVIADNLEFQNFLVLNHISAIK